MASPLRATGATLIEAMVAMSVLLAGSMGLIGVHRAGLAMNADARTITRATALAQDLVEQMQMWSWNDPRLQNTTTSNDADFADASGSFQGASFAFDHQESELESAPAIWNGVPIATAQGLGFTRYWNVAEPDLDANGALVAKRVAVIVRWAHETGPRRVVLVTVIRNPGMTN